MARFTGALTQGLMNPTYQGSLGEAAGMLGGLGGAMLKDRQNKERAMEMRNAPDQRAMMEIAIKQARTPAEILAAQQALTNFDQQQAQLGRQKELQTREDLTFAQGQADRDKAADVAAATPLLSAAGTRYDLAMRSGNKEAAKNILAGMEKTAGRAGLNVRDFIDTSREPVTSKAKRYDQVGDYMFDTQTGEFLTPNADGALTKVDWKPKEFNDNVEKLAEDGNWTDASLVDYRTAVSGGEDPVEAGKLLEAVDPAIQKANQKRVAVDLIENQLDIIADIEEVMPEDWSDQIASKVFNWIPGTDAMTLQDAVDTLEARMAFDELQTMRQNSKTGGALGSVSEKELSLLKAAFRNLNPASDQFPANLRALEDRYLNILSIERGAPKDFNEQGFSMDDPQYRREGDRIIWLDRRTGREYDANTFDEIR